MERDARVIDEVVEQVKPRLLEEEERGDRFGREDTIAWVVNARRKELRQHAARATVAAAREDDSAWDPSPEDISPALWEKFTQRRTTVAASASRTFDEEAYWRSSVGIAAVIWKALASPVDAARAATLDRPLPRGDVDGDQDAIFTTPHGTVDDIARQCLVAPPLERDEKNLFRVLGSADGTAIAMSELALRLGLADAAEVGAITRKLGRRINTALRIESRLGGVTGSNLLIEWKQKKVGAKREYHFKLRPGVKEALRREGVI